VKLPGGMGNMQAMMKQAQQMQQKIQEEIAQIRVEGSAGGGMVTVRMDGLKNVLAVKIDPEVAGDVEMLRRHGGGGLQRGRQEGGRRGAPEDGRDAGRPGIAAGPVLSRGGCLPCRTIPNRWPA
jgi:hypothetical protein